MFVRKSEEEVEFRRGNVATTIALELTAEKGSPVHDSLIIHDCEPVSSHRSITRDTPLFQYNDGIPEDSRARVPGYEWLRERFEGEKARADIEKVKGLAPIASELGCTMAQLALAWCLANPRVSTVITGASKPEQVVENMAALSVADRLDDGVLDRIEEILGNRPQLEHDWR